MSSTPTSSPSAGATPSTLKRAPQSGFGRLLATFTGLNPRHKFMICLAVVLAGLGIFKNIHDQRTASAAANAKKQAIAEQQATAATKPQIPAGLVNRFGDEPSAAKDADKDANKLTEPMGQSTRRDVGEYKSANNANDAANNHAGSADDDAATTENRPAGQPTMSKPRDTKRILPEMFGMPYDERDALAQGEANRPVDSSPPTSRRGGGTASMAIAATANARSAGADAEAKITSEFAPYGRLVKCTLLGTVDSLAPSDVPLIAIVCEPLNWNGKTIIPVNTEVHGFVDTKPQIDANGVGRLFDRGQFTMVLPRGPQGRTNGRELLVRGRVLDRRESVIDPIGKAQAWDINDMAPGLIGYTISTLDKEEIKLFTAAFLGAAAKAAGAVMTPQQSATGLAGQAGATVPTPSAQGAIASAAGAGVSAVMDRTAERIEESIKTRGLYVRVPASKDFYLYIEQTIDPLEAKVGLKLPTKTESQPPSPSL